MESGHGGSQGANGQIFAVIEKWFLGDLSGLGGPPRGMQMASRTGLRSASKCVIRISTPLAGTSCSYQINAPFSEGISIATGPSLIFRVAVFAGPWRKVQLQKTRTGQPKTFTRC